MKNTVIQMENPRNSFSATATKIVLMNLVPLIGVIWFGWSARTVILIYVLETVIVGLVHIVRLTIVWLMNRGNPLVVTPPNTSEWLNGPGGILFFCFHFFFFVGVQMVVANGFFSTFDKDGLAVSLHDIFYGDLRWPLVVFLGTQIAYLSTEFMYRKYRNAHLGSLFFQPYPRIFVQQFVVIIGGFFAMIGLRSFGYLLVLVLIKMLTDLLFVGLRYKKWRKWIASGDKVREQQLDDFDKYSK